MKIVIDMNLSPQWEEVLNANGIEAIHWSKLGSPSASDFEILKWAIENSYIIFTHDLDFGAILANSRGQGPSVFQVRTQEVSPSAIGKEVCAALKKFELELTKGALISLIEGKSKVRILPIH